MARLMKRHLPHRVSIQQLEGEGPEGDVWGDRRDYVPAYVEQRTRLVVDRRGNSPTKGQEITATTLVVLLPEDGVVPRARVTVWPGTSRQRTSEVIDAAYFDYPGAPGHWELYLE